MKNTIFYGNPIALNYAVPADGAPLTVQLSPFGEFALHDGGKRNGTVQHCTRAAFEAMVANWKAAGSPEILVDVDHASATGRSTEAAAWATNLRVDDNGLCADFTLTPRGRELIGGRQYRFVWPLRLPVTNSTAARSSRSFRRSSTSSARFRRTSRAKSWARRSRSKCRSSKWTPRPR